jgi:NAD(P)-dependent dehydrogenase (short-subunit alcohol dehydrogenase family)
MHSLLTIAFRSADVASKHGVNGWTGSLFEAIRDKGIKVTAVNPAFTDTPMIQGAPYYNKRASIPTESVAHAIHFAASFPGGGCPTDITIYPQYSQ